MADILDEIIAHKKLEVADAKARVTPEEIQRRARARSPARSMFDTLSKGGVRIIAECKRKSPSKGLIAAQYDPVSLAVQYEEGGAAAISVLTDERYFGGSLIDLAGVSERVGIPVLRKDFIIDEYQVYEARAYGADSFLLLSGVLDPATLEHLTALGRTLGMEPLIESHTATQLDGVLAGTGRILGINNRNLKTFQVDLEHARSLYSTIKGKDPGLIPVCESGIRGPDDVVLMGSVGYKVFLIGEALVTHPNPRAAIVAMLSQKTGAEEGV